MVTQTDVARYASESSLLFETGFPLSLKATVNQVG